MCGVCVGGVRVWYMCVCEGECVCVCARLCVKQYGFHVPQRQVRCGRCLCGCEDRSDSMLNVWGTLTQDSQPVAATLTLLR